MDDTREKVGRLRPQYRSLAQSRSGLAANPIFWHRVHQAPSEPQTRPPPVFGSRRVPDSSAL